MDYYISRTIVAFVASCLMFTVCGCNDIASSLYQSKPQVDDPSQVSHPDELIRNQDGSISYKPGITGEDIIKQLRGEPLNSYEKTSPETQVKYKVLVYKHDSTSPVNCFTYSRSDGTFDLIFCTYDSAYGIYEYKDMYIAEKRMDSYNDGEKADFARWIDSAGLN